MRKGEREIRQERTGFIKESFNNFFFTLFVKQRGSATKYAGVSRLWERLKDFVDLSELKQRTIRLLSSVMILGIMPLFVQCQQVAPADREVTAETGMLYQNMVRMMDKGVMFGHHEDLAYGVGWEYQKGRSDVKDVTGSYPAVYGWDLSRIELDSTRNLDNVPFDKMVTYIQEVYKRGGINTICWHLNDPVTDSTSWSMPKNTVRLILDSVKYQNAYKVYLNKAADFIGKLRGDDGKMIPVIFRPFHEFTGNWFWWGKTECTPKEFIALWRLTFDYLVETKHLHNLLFAYSSADFYSPEDYLERYPGDHYVDVMGFDAYCTTASYDFQGYLGNRLDMLSRVSLEHLKIPAITEFGYNSIPVANWWTKTVLPVVSEYRLSYMMAWRNWKDDHFFTPYPGQMSAHDFKLFYDDPVTLFQDDLKPSIYEKLIQ